MRTKIVAGNWKMNTTVPEGVELAKNVLAGISGKPSDVMLILGVPFTHITKVGEIISGSGIGLAAQNCADKESGAYTGEVSASMLRSAGCGYVILGHSERRQYYGETDERLVAKLALAMKEGLVPIFCVGETLEQREAGNHFNVVESQVRNVLFTLDPVHAASVIVAYEPVWAIGTGKTATAEQAQEMHAFIRSVIAEKYGQAVADETSILYGGSCNAKNADEIFSQPDVDGGLIGGASLKAADFFEIIKARARH